jgi:hypothetical protein
MVRNAVPGQRAVALHRASAILALEARMHIDVERPLNHLVAVNPWLAYGCNYYYATLHLAVTIAVLAWLYVRHPLRYRAMRSALFAINLLGLAVFWCYAVAPPRMLGNGRFVDTIAAFHTWGSWDSAAVARISNQVAAMPSLHVGWSLWCAIVVGTLTRRRWVRGLACAYPLLTVFVILGTGNHFLLDAVGGVVVVALGFGVQRLIHASGEEHVLVSGARPPGRSAVVLD